MHRMELSKIPLRRLPRLHSQALARLTLRTFAETHAILLPVQVWLAAQVQASADEEGNAEPMRLMGLATQFEVRWKPAMQQYTRLLHAAREQAASLPFGALVVEHNAMMAGVRKPVQEAMTPEEVGRIIRLWQQRRMMALGAMERRVYGDGLQLSQRIWRLEAGGLERVRAQLAAAMTQRTNAWQLATMLERELGADQNFPRWAWSRLYGMTPGSRATSAEGLLRGPEVGGQGVAYNALRLARNEIQNANHAVTTEIATHNPAVTGRKTALSGSHSGTDICDELAAGGPYDKTRELLPAHVACMCYYINVLMPKPQFTTNVRGWLDGNNNFLDDYAAWLGTRQPTEPLDWAMPIAESLELWLSVGQAAQAAALRV
jgi:hypothetical protein